MISACAINTAGCSDRTIAGPETALATFYGLRILCSGDPDGDLVAGDDRSDEFVRVDYPVSGGGQNSRDHRSTWMSARGTMTIIKIKGANRSRVGEGGADGR